MTTEYGSRLKQARTSAGMTQVDLSTKTGIAQSTISSAERRGNGSGETPVYAQACGVDALWLATGQGAITPLINPSEIACTNGNSLMAKTLAECLDQIPTGPDKIAVFLACLKLIETAIRLDSQA